MVENVSKHLKEYFENETYVNPEMGYTDDFRGVDYMEDNLLPRIKKLYNENIFKRCLDVGCAQGYFTKVLSPMFEVTYGVDFSENRINYAKKYEKDNLKFICADLTEELEPKFPIKFDFMFTNAVIPHIPASLQKSVFENLSRIAEKDCIFVIYDKLNEEQVSQIENWEPGYPIKIDFFSENSLRDLNGWELLSILSMDQHTDEIVLKKI